MPSADKTIIESIQGNNWLPNSSLKRESAQAKSSTKTAGLLSLKTDNHKSLFLHCTKKE